MPEIGSSGLMSGGGGRSVAEWPKLPRPSSTLPKRIYIGGSASLGSVAVHIMHQLQCFFGLGTQQRWPKIYRHLACFEFFQQISNRFIDHVDGVAMFVLDIGFGRHQTAQHAHRKVFALQCDLAEITLKPARAFAVCTNTLCGHRSGLMVRIM